MQAEDVASYIATRCLDQGAADMQVFPLLGRDASAPTVVAFWILQNISTAPPEKLREALESALTMRHTAGRKVAD